MICELRKEEGKAAFQTTAVVLGQCLCFPPSTWHSTSSHMRLPSQARPSYPAHNLKQSQVSSPLRASKAGLEAASRGSDHQEGKIAQGPFCL